MSKKDFQLIANVMNERKPERSNVEQTAAWRNIVRGLAVALSETNPRFNQDRFLKACGDEER